MHIFANFLARILILFKHKSDLREYLSAASIAGNSIGLVPTMGALHEGHISLLNIARAHCSLTVCSVFVNPTQFNDPSDLDKYPRTIENDIRMLANARLDVLFYPEVNEMYENLVSEKFDHKGMAAVFEGSSRPGHFDGVATIVRRLFEAVSPDKAFFGMKDYQQCLVISEFTRQAGLDTEIVICPTVREENGLAMSSRNRRLSAEQRENASAIYTALRHLKNSLDEASLPQALSEAKSIIERIPGAKIDYLNIADAGSLKPVGNWNESGNLIALAAVNVDGVRLIDNLLIKGQAPFTVA